MFPMEAEVESAYARSLPRGIAKAVERRGEPRDPSNLIRLRPA
jgi:hypothetical protein